jgi:parallel beta-helix repeat protein
MNANFFPSILTRMAKSKWLSVLAVLALLFAALPAAPANAATDTFTTPGTANWVAPAGVTTVTVEVWGGGGKGGDRDSNGAGGGGGGGAYSIKANFPVVPGNSYTVVVGAGASTTGPGGDSYFVSTATVMAKGGGSVANNTSAGAAGGLASAGVGDTKYSGGTGANAGGNNGGGGGSSAGTAGPGTNGNGSSGGSAPTGGGAGGAGRSGSSGDGTSGSTPGGAGGGAYRTGFSTRGGGDGANGQVRITYTVTNYTLTVNKSGAGTGTVTSSPAAITCGTTCSASFAYNTPVTLTAVAATGSTFGGWSGGGCTGTGTCSVTMTAGTSVTANFTAVTYTIVGNAGVAGATLSYTDGTPKTASADSAGAYSFTVPYNWSGTVTPSNPGYIFSPANKTYTNVLANKNGENYTASAVFTISGSAGTPGATLTYTDGALKTVAADGSGNYVLTVSAGWSGQVTPSMPGFTFSPLSSTYNNVSANLTGEDYTATAVPVTISGYAGIAGVTLSYTDGTPKTITDSGAGNYTITVPYNWSGTVTPSKAGYAFGPSAKSYTNVTADQTFQNYTALNSAKTFYVDNTTACRDDGPGSITVPFCSIGRGADAASAGNTVRVLNGTYAETVKPQNSGSAGSPITFSAAPGVTVTGKVDATGDAFRIISLNYITIDGFTVTGTADSGINVEFSSYITVSNNHVSYSGTGGTAPAGSMPGIYFYTSTDSTINGNTTDHNTDSGIKLSGACTRITINNNVTFANAVVLQRQANGIMLNASSNNTVEHNISYNNEDTGIGFYDASSNNVVVGNLSYGNGDHGIDNFNSPNNKIIGNTIQGNVTVGINLEGDTTGSGGATVENNLSADNGLNPPSGLQGNLRADVLSLTSTLFEYNTVSHDTSLGGSSTQVIWGNTSYNFITDFHAANPTQESHGRQVDSLSWILEPLPASRPLTGGAPTINVGDFHLNAGSPAIDSANAAAPNEPALDIEGKLRVDDTNTPNTGNLGTTYDDRGAYEFQQPACFALTITTGTNGTTPTASPTKSAECLIAGNYVQDAHIQLTAEPAAHYLVASWSGTDSDVSTATTNTVTMPASAHTVGVIYTPVVYTLTVNADHGTVGRNNPGPYHFGDVVQLTATPSAGWSFANWTVDVTSSSNPINVTMDGNKIVTANYSQNEYTLTVTSAHGTVGLDKTGPYHYGDVVRLTATPDTGWSFANWSGNASETSPVASVTMDNNKSVTANYTENEYSLTITSAHGTVTPDVSGPYHYGDVVKLTTNPEIGWSFTDWAGDATATDNPVSITMTDNKSVTANYTQIEYTLTVISAHGTVNFDNPGPYHYGDVVQITAVPDNGWYFVNWTGDAGSINNPVSVTIDGNKTVTATYHTEKVMATLSLKSETVKTFLFDGASHLVQTDDILVSAPGVTTVDGTLSNIRYEGSATAPTNAGSFQITADFVPADGMTYATLTGEYVDTLVIEKAAQSITVTSTLPDRPTNSSTFDVSATGGASGNPVVITTIGSCTGGGNDTATITLTGGTGACVIHYNQQGTSNYQVATEVTESVAVPNYGIYLPIITD